MQNTPNEIIVPGQQRFELRRAHQFYLPLLSQHMPQSPAVTQTPIAVQVMATAKAQLRGLLYTQGEFRGGPIFGKRGERFEIHQAHLGGYSSLLKHDPLACSPEYLLGLTDAYQQCQPELDWIGHWLTWPHRQIPSLRESLQWFEDAHELGLVSEEYGFLIIGWHESQLCGSTAFVDGEHQECHWLPAEF